MPIFNPNEIVGSIEVREITPVDALPTISDGWGDDGVQLGRVHFTESALRSVWRKLCTSKRIILNRTPHSLEICLFIDPRDHFGAVFYLPNDYAVDPYLVSNGSLDDPRVYLSDVFQACLLAISRSTLHK